MILKTMWGKRVGGEGDAPELMVAWDEYCVDGNERGFEDDCRRTRQSWGTDLADWGHGWEGIVWHHPDGRMAKLKARDLPTP